MFSLSEEESNRLIGGRKKKSSRRSSILKIPKSPARNALEDIDSNSADERTTNTKRLSRRVSFAQTCTIKEFIKKSPEPAAPDWVQTDVSKPTDLLQKSLEKDPNRSSVSASGLQSLMTGQIENDIVMSSACEEAFKESEPSLTMSEKIASQDFYPSATLASSNPSVDLKAQQLQSISGGGCQTNLFPNDGDVMELTEALPPLPVASEYMNATWANETTKVYTKSMLVSNMDFTCVQTENKETEDFKRLYAEQTQIFDSAGGVDGMDCTLALAGEFHVASNSIDSADKENQPIVPRVNAKEVLSSKPKAFDGNEIFGSAKIDTQSFLRSLGGATSSSSLTQFDKSSTDASAGIGKFNIDSKSFQANLGWKSLPDLDRANEFDESILTSAPEGKIDAHSFLSSLSGKKPANKNAEPKGGSGNFCPSDVLERTRRFSGDDEDMSITICMDEPASTEPRAAIGPTSSFDKTVIYGLNETGVGNADLEMTMCLGGDTPHKDEPLMQQLMTNEQKENLEVGSKNRNSTALPKSSKTRKALSVVSEFRHDRTVIGEDNLELTQCVTANLNAEYIANAGGSTGHNLQTHDNIAILSNKTIIGEADLELTMCVGGDTPNNDTSLMQSIVTNNQIENQGERLMSRNPTALTKSNKTRKVLSVVSEPTFDKTITGEDNVELTQCVANDLNVEHVGKASVKDGNIRLALQTPDNISLYANKTIIGESDLEMTTCLTSNLGEKQSDKTILKETSLEMTTCLPSNFEEGQSNKTLFEAANMDMTRCVATDFGEKQSNKTILKDSSVELTTCLPSNFEEGQIDQTLLGVTKVELTTCLPSDLIEDHQLSNRNPRYIDETTIVDGNKTNSHGSMEMTCVADDIERTEAIKRSRSAGSIGSSNKTINFGGETMDITCMPEKSMVQSSFTNKTIHFDDETKANMQMTYIEQNNMQNRTEQHANKTILYSGDATGVNMDLSCMTENTSKSILNINKTVLSDGDKTGAAMDITCVSGRSVGSVGSSNKTMHYNNENMDVTCMPMQGVSQSSVSNKSTHFNDATRVDMELTRADLPHKSTEQNTNKTILYSDDATGVNMDMSCMTETVSKSILNMNKSSLFDGNKTGAAMDLTCAIEPTGHEKSSTNKTILISSEKTNLELTCMGDNMTAGEITSTVETTTTTITSTFQRKKKSRKSVGFKLEENTFHGGDLSLNKDNKLLTEEELMRQMHPQGMVSEQPMSARLNIQELTQQSLSKEMYADKENEISNREQSVELEETNFAGTEGNTSDSNKTSHVQPLNESLFKDIGCISNNISVGDMSCMELDDVTQTKPTDERPVCDISGINREPTMNETGLMELTQATGNVPTSSLFLSMSCAEEPNDKSCLNVVAASPSNGKIDSEVRTYIDTHQADTGSSDMKDVEKSVDLATDSNAKGNATAFDASNTQMDNSNVSLFSNEADEEEQLEEMTVNKSRLLALKERLSKSLVMSPTSSKTNSVEPNRPLNRTLSASSSVQSSAMSSSFKNSGERLNGQRVRQLTVFRNTEEGKSLTQESSLTQMSSTSSSQEMPNATADGHAAANMYSKDKSLVSIDSNVAARPTFGKDLSHAAENILDEEPPADMMLSFDVHEPKQLELKTKSVTDEHAANRKRSIEDVQEFADNMENKKSKYSVTESLHKRSVSMRKSSVHDTDAHRSGEKGMLSESCVDQFHTSPGKELFDGNVASNRSAINKSNLQRNTQETNQSTTHEDLNFTAHIHADNVFNEIKPVHDSSILPIMHETHYERNKSHLSLSALPSDLDMLSDLSKKPRLNSTTLTEAERSRHPSSQANQSTLARSLLGSSSLMPRLTSSELSYRSNLVVDDVSHLDLESIDDYLALFDVQFVEKNSRRSTIVPMSMNEATTVSEIIGQVIHEPHTRMYEWACQQITDRIDQYKVKIAESEKKLLDNLPAVFKTSSGDAETCKRLSKLKSSCRKKAEIDFKLWKHKMLKNISASLQEEELTVEDALEDLKTSISAIENKVVDLKKEDEELELRTQKVESNLEKLPMINQVEELLTEASHRQKVGQQLEADVHQQKTCNDKIQSRKLALQVDLDTLSTKLNQCNKVTCDELNQQLDILKHCGFIEIKTWEENEATLLLLENTMCLKLVFGAELPAKWFSNRNHFRIVDINLRSLLKESSSKSVLLAHKLVLARFPRSKLQECGSDTQRLPKLLHDMASVMSVARQLVWGIEQAGTGDYHQSSVQLDTNSIKVVFSSMKCRCYFEVKFVIDLLNYPALPLQWTSNVMLGAIREEDITDAIESIEPGKSFFTRILNSLNDVVKKNIASASTNFLKQNRDTLSSSKLF